MTEWGEMPAGIMPDFRRELPSCLQEMAGNWVWHKIVRPGVIKHVGRDGSILLSVRVLLPPNGLLSASSLRLLASWIRKYALVGRRTSRQSFELVGVDPVKLDMLLKEIYQSGFLVGGTGRTAHQIKCCTSFVHCQNAALDAPSLAKVLGDHLWQYFQDFSLPAWLKISISGCPNGCGGGVEADIGIIGVYQGFPEVDDEALAGANEDIGLLVSWCPTKAIRPKATSRGTSVTINLERCVRCSSCMQAVLTGIKLKGERGAAILVGGRGGSTPSLAGMVFPFLPIKSLDYTEIKEKITRILEVWIKGARPGERLGAFVERLGWGRFLKAVGGSALEEGEYSINGVYFKQNLRFKF
ncbi:sulfite reductase beta subunit [Thermanaeromonas toyohensis ToBE]|uniref:Sulfite reductase beta subunit n=1 Tax=Thermanaeromonas toyohensis ToBE TaxID=698762 RepID=A0A1W1VZB8_9FIRM|nr:hypothetical protein [Thermanaeromonas toyohensis]SMB98686.1 sulfite reductase beta subunit [Thermanaeromonas toyohensis ToBE]